MKGKIKLRGPDLLIVAFVVLAVLLLLLRMIVFVLGRRHGHHGL